MKRPGKIRRFWAQIRPELPGGSSWRQVAADVAALLCVLAAGVWLLVAILTPDPHVSVTLAADGARISYRLMPGGSVADLLDESGISLREGDELSHALQDPIEEGMEIELTRAFPVAVRSKESVTVLNLCAGTVGEALRKAGVAADVNDELSAYAFLDVSPGMQIVHIDVQTMYTTSYKTLNYKEVAQYDEDVYDDTEPVLIQSGEDGTKQVTQRLVIKDGVEVSREVVDQVVITPATNEIYKYGTKIHYMTNYYGDTRIYKKKPVAGQNGWVEMKMDYITAYDGDTRTATGNKPKFGTIAVSPRYIPYYTEIWVPGYGYGKALDTGAFRNYTNPDGSYVNQLDVFFVRKSDATRWGRKRNVTVLVKLG